MAELPSDQSVSSELQLSTCTSNSGSSTAQSSPDYNPSAASFLPHPGDESLSLVINVGNPSISTSGAQVLQSISREEALKSLRESIPHKMTLQRLHKSEKNHRKDASFHKKAVRRLSKELYWVVTLYALMEGALFAAVAQSSVFTCADWWGPMGLGFAVMLGTIVGVCDKLQQMGRERKQVRDFERRASAVHDRIELLYWRGAACVMDELDPDRRDDLVDAAGISWQQDHSSCIFSPYGVLVLGFIVVFSFLIAASCSAMLCGQPCRCKASASASAST